MSDSRVNRDRRQARATKILTAIADRADLARIEAELHDEQAERTYQHTGFELGAL